MNKHLPHVLRDMEVADFGRFLARHGASTMPTTNQWEVIRYRARGQTKGVCVIYRDKRDRLNFAGCDKHYRAFMLDRDPFADTSLDKPLTKTEPEPTGHCDLFTDAGYHLRTKSGAWGAVLRIGGDIHESAGALKGDIGSSTSAEARGVANALHRFIVDRRIPRGAHVRIVCDNQTVVNYLNNGLNSKTPDVAIAIQAARTLAESHGLTLAGAWVKGHQAKGQQTADGLMNARCDKLATNHCLALHYERGGKKKGDKKKRARAVRREAEHGQAV